jgi:sucrose-6-phosphate hydrolase SacC (GH32 family)
MALKPGDNPLATVQGELFDIRAEIDLGDATEVSLIVRGEPMIYSVEKRQLTALGIAPLPLENGRLTLHILVDRTSIETFADSGRVSLTSCFAPKPDDLGLALTARGGTASVRSVAVFELKSAWR